MPGNNEKDEEMDHNPIARYCIELIGLPASEYRDDVTCPACDALIDLMELDPDVEILTPHPGVRARLRAAEMHAIEVHDFAGAHMLGDICQEWEAGRMPRGNAEIALASAAKRARSYR